MAKQKTVTVLMSIDHARGTEKIPAQLGVPADEVPALKAELIKKHVKPGDSVNWTILP